MQNGSQFVLGTGTPIQKAKATGNVLQVTVAQKAPTAAASLNGVLLRVALDLKAGQNLAQGTLLTLSSDAVKCQVLDGTGTISSIPVSVGTLSAQ
jgi:Kef-type K+ transport system membrane component KefB